MLFRSPVSAADILTNGGFEYTNLDSWISYTPSGGTCQVVISGFGGFSAIEGRYYAQLRTNSWPNQYTTLSRSFYAVAGSRITGYSYFKTTDYMPYNDDGAVMIKASSGSVVRTLFQASVSTVGDYGSTPWRYWEHVFSTSGTYTIEARVSNQRDGGVDSYLGIDGVRLQTPYNNPPVAVAGPDQTVEATAVTGAWVTLNGSGSYDPNGNSLYYTWWGPSGFVGNQPVVNVYLPLGTHTCTLNVYDGQYHSSDSIQVTVTDTTVPTMVVPDDLSVEATGLETQVDIGEALAYDIFPVTIENDAPLMFPLGTTVVNWTATDSNGNVYTGVQKVTIYDHTSPEIDISIENGSVFYLGQESCFFWSAADHQSGLALVSATLEDASVLDTSAVGAFSASVTAVDNAGNVAFKEVFWNIRYVYEGPFLPPPPLKSGQYNLRRTIPISFSLKDNDGNNVETAHASFDYSQDGVTWIECASGGKSNIGNLFRYIPDEGKYIFNLSTAQMSAGNVILRIRIDDGTERYLNIKLR